MALAAITAFSWAAALAAIATLTATSAAALDAATISSSDGLSLLKCDFNK
ncbi:hypothetical protein Hanom_Chr17g01578681 [Helianthus anomalus]